MCLGSGEFQADRFGQLSLGELDPARNTQAQVGALAAASVAVMTALVALLLVAAVGHALGAGGRVHLGWLAVACVIAAALMVPALTAL